MLYLHRLGAHLQTLRSWCTWREFRSALLNGPCLRVANLGNANDANIQGNNPDDGPGDDIHGNNPEDGPGDDDEDDDGNDNEDGTNEDDCSNKDEDLHVKEGNPGDDEDDDGDDDDSSHEDDGTE